MAYRSFAELVSCNHPTIWKLINELRQEQSRNDVVIQQFIAGQVLPLPKEKYYHCAERIANVSPIMHGLT